MYPMIKLFRHGVFQEDYNGERNAGIIFIIQFLLEKLYKIVLQKTGRVQIYTFFIGNMSMRNMKLKLSKN